jgi:hypothetical protein
MKTTIYVFVTLTIISMTILGSCKKETEQKTTYSTPQTKTVTIFEKQLTPEQKKAMFWTDWAAGVATAELGPISFAIAGAASAAYYYDHISGIVINPNPDPKPTNTNELPGYYHNLLCKAYIAKGFDHIVFSEFIKTAKEVRPDLINELNSLTDSMFNSKIQYARSFDYIGSSDQVNVISSFNSINSNDLVTFKNGVTNIQNSLDANQFNVNTNNLIDQIGSFSMPLDEKEKIISSLMILKYSGNLWKF